MRAVLIVSLAFLALGSCSPLQRKCGCPPSDEKVCGKLPDGSYKLFHGSCRLGCADASVVKDSYCYGTGLLPPPHPVHIICGCAPIKNPVCAEGKDGALADFSNPCSAGCAGARVVGPGKCADQAPAVPHFRLCGCKPVDKPVCTIIPGGSPKTYSNQCEAGCHDAVVVHEGKCE